MGSDGPRTEEGQHLEVEASGEHQGYLFLDDPQLQEKFDQSVARLAVIPTGFEIEEANVTAIQSVRDWLRRKPSERTIRIYWFDAVGTRHGLEPVGEDESGWRRIWSGQEASAREEASVRVGGQRAARANLADELQASHAERQELKAGVRSAQENLRRIARRYRAAS
jgi:hypothetical protein